MKWVRSLNSESGNTTVKEAKELTNISKDVQKRIMTGDKSLILPLISYYGTGTKFDTILWNNYFMAAHLHKWIRG